MKALVLSAGQGRRLLPLTETRPKCLVPLAGRPLLEWQLDALGRAGVDRVVVVVGFGAEWVERAIGTSATWPAVEILYNPFFQVSDNLGSCWIARAEMNEDFVLVNGDTLFEAPILEELMGTPSRPVTLAIDRAKPVYDDDDMKVSLDGDRLVRVGKKLRAEETDGESIGLMVMRGGGPAIFREAVETRMRRPEGLGLWYLSVIDELARDGLVWTNPVNGHGWAEVDFPADLERAERVVARQAQALARAFSGPGPRPRLEPGPSR